MVSNTKETLMREAEKLIRTRGYAAFSYGDLAELVGIRKASIHHHFPTKEALGAAIVDTYLEKFETELQEVLDREPLTGERLSQYIDFFASSMSDGLLPLCGALASEKSALPDLLQQRVSDFFELHLKWLNTVVGAGIEAKELRQDLVVEDSAQFILSTLEGACLVSWATGDSNNIPSTKRQLLSALGSLNVEAGASVG